MPIGWKQYYFGDKDAAEGKDEGASDTKGKEKGEGQDGKREKRVYEPRPPFAANPGPYVMERWKDGREKQDREMQNKKCVIS